MSCPQEALQLLKCSACDNYLSYFPIFITQNYQQLCGRCSSNLEEKSIRNTTYESLVQYIKFPCIYNKEGCNERVFPPDVPNHEQICPYRNICCALDCMWQGTANELRDHFEELHPASIVRDGQFEMDFLNSYETYSLLIYNDEIFSFKRKYDHGDCIVKYSLFCFKVLDTVTRYNYKIILQNGSRNLSVEFPPKSAENFDPRNETEISLEVIKNKLEDPSMIIGTVKIFEDVRQRKPIERKPNPEIHTEMLRELECPVCFDYIVPPIFQCVTGHSICADCKGKVIECPTCKQEIKNTQNFTLEKMAYYLTYPCKFTEYGCDFASKPSKIKQHQNFCLHGPHTCPLKEYENCIWKNAAKEIFTHVYQKHFDNILEIDTVDAFIDDTYLNGEEANCYILKLGSFLFKLHYLYRDRTFFWAMQVIGPPEEAKNYKFEIDIIDKSQSDRRMFIRSYCSSLSESSEAFRDTKCYIYLKLDQIKSFIPEDIFTYRVRIIK